MATITHPPIAARESLMSNEMWQGTRVDMEAIKRHYLVLDDESTSCFLAEYPMVVFKLLEAHPYIVAVWGDDAIAKLELSYDPEDQEYEKIFVHIQTEEPVKQAMSSLREFDKTWWIENSHELINKLNFDIEFS